MIDLVFAVDHRITEACVCVDNHCPQVTTYRMHAESYSGHRAVHHRLNHDRHATCFMAKALVMAISDGPFRPKRDVASPDLVQQMIESPAIERGLVHAREGGIGKIFQGGGRPDREPLIGRKSGQPLS